MSANVIEMKICPQCDRMWPATRPGEQMCTSCALDMRIRQGVEIGPAPGTVERAQVVALAEGWEKEAKQYGAQIEECRVKGLEFGCQLGTKTALEACAKTLRGLL